MKMQVDKGQREVNKWRKGGKVVLSTKDLVFKERPVKKLTERYIGFYVTEEIISRNAMKLKLLASIRIHPVVNVSKIVRYKELVKRQKLKPVKTDRVEEWKVEKILNKRKVRRVIESIIYNSNTWNFIKFFCINSIQGSSFDLLLSLKL